MTAAARPTPLHKHKTLGDYTPKQQACLIRAFNHGLELDHPLATPGRTAKLQNAGLITQRETKKRRIVWKATDLGRAVVAAHVPVMLAAQSQYGYTSKPWRAMRDEGELMDADARDRLDRYWAA